MITFDKQVLISSPTRSIDKVLDESQMKIGCALAGGHNASIAKAVFAHKGIREEVLLKVMDLVNEEVDTLCRKEKDDQFSPFRHIPVTKLESFSLQIADNNCRRSFHF